MKTEGNENKHHISPSELSEEDFKGYTMEELKYQRALLLIKREFLREKALRETKKIKSQIPLLNGQSGLSSFPVNGIMGKMMKGLGFADYLVLGIQAVKIGKKIGSLFRRK